MKDKQPTRKMRSMRLPDSTMTQIAQIGRELKIDSQADVVIEAVRQLHIARVAYPTFNIKTP